MQKTRARIIDPQTSLEFPKCASEICRNINIIHCPTEIIENEMKSPLWRVAVMRPLFEA